MDAWLASLGPFVHRADPVMLHVGRIRLWYYGLAYAIGFLGIHVCLRRRQAKLGWRREDVYACSILLAVAALVVGHVFEIIVYEWAYYRAHPWDIFNYWRGGMATHGVLLGAMLGVWLFCRRREKSILAAADELAVPGAFFMAMGRIGNFINGENYGPATAVWWAVKFPYADGFRHPVDIYDALKNLMIVPILLLVRRTPARARGLVFAHFVFWYGFLRLLIDLFRDYGADFLGIGRGQYFNLAMALTGLALMIWCWLAGRRPGMSDPVAETSPQPHEGADGPVPEEVRRGAPRLRLKRLALASILLFSLTIPSGWSQGWLQRLRDQHAADPSHSASVR